MLAKRIKRSGSILLLLAGSASAQLTVDMALNQNVYLLGEAIRADVSIVNHATTPLMIGPGVHRRNGLSFQIKDRRQDTLTTTQPDTAMIANLQLAGGATFRAAYELDEWYPMGNAGSYIVTAMVRRDDRRYESVARAFDVVPGLEIKTAIQLFADLPDQQRKLSLVYFMRRQAEYLFLRITDTPGERTWSTLELGKLLRTTPPTIEITPDGVVTIVHRASQDVFLKTRVKSTIRGVELVGQQQTLDKQSEGTFSAAETRRMIEAAQKPQSKSSWWWPFGSSKENTSTGK